MKLDPIMLLIAGITIYPILKGIIFGFSSYSLKRDLEGIVDSVSFIAAIFIGIKYFRNIFLQYGQTTINGVTNYLPDSISSFIQQKPIIIYFVLIPLLIYIIYKIISSILLFICNITIYHAIDAAGDAVKGRSFVFRSTVGALVQVPKAICFLLVTLLILNVVSMFNVNKEFNNYLMKSDTYKYLCKEIVIPITNTSVAKKLPEIIDNSVKIVVKENNLNKSSIDNSYDLNNLPINQSDTNTIVYYNGVTLEQGIKSNSAIDNFAREYAASQSDVLDKAKRLYSWEGQNIDYDYSKAEKVLNNNYNVSSGAIPTFTTRKGICFDYSCLYVAMCRANNIKVRIVTGEGFNGVSWVSHAWNMVYIPDEKTWINVDTTFSKGGNYFNSRLFNLDHRNAKIIGEW